jgi:hypothetical protein
MSSKLRKDAMLKIASIIATVAVCISSTAFALSVVDKNGTSIGEIIAFNEWFGAPIDGGLQAVVVLFDEETPYAVRLGRDTLGGTHQLHFEKIDCTGTAGIPMFPEDRPEILIHPSAAGPDGIFWMMTRDRMFEIVTESFWNEVTEECESIEPTKQWLTPVKAVGNLNTEFEAPFYLKEPIPNSE